MEQNDTHLSKYEAALAKYNTNLSDADVQARVAAIIENKVAENNTEEVKKLLFNCIDLTSLNSTDNDESIMKFSTVPIRIPILPSLRPSFFTIRLICFGVAPIVRSCP